MDALRHRHPESCVLREGTERHGLQVSQRGRKGPPALLVSSACSSPPDGGQSLQLKASAVTGQCFRKRVKG